MKRTKLNFIGLILLSISVIGLIVLLRPETSFAQESKLGIHIMRPNELSQAVDLFKNNQSPRNDWHYLTIPLTLDDLDKKEQ